MVLVWGTRTYGQDDGFSRYDYCEHCGEHGRLKTYSTAKFGHLYFIPIVPLGKKRVFDACPRCEMHKEAPLATFNKGKEADLAKVFEVLEGQRQAPEAVTKSVLTLLAYGQFEHFKAAAPVIEREYAKEAEVLGAVAAVYNYLGDLEAAERLYSQSLILEESNEDQGEGTRIALAANRIHQLKVDGVRDLLSPLLAKGDKENTGIFYFLVEGLLHTARHDEAQKVLSDIEALNEAVVEDEDHKNYLKKAEAGRVSQLEVSSLLLGKRKGVERLGRGIPLWMPGLLPLSGILFVVGTYLLSAISLGAAQTVWLVNGTNHSYTVTINGEDYLAPANNRKEISLPEGTINYVIKDAVFPVKSQSARISTDFTSRPFNDSVFVLNPDGIALLGIQTTTYAPAGSGTVPNKMDWRSGQTFYVFHGIDFPFREFPSTLALDSKSSRVSKTRVSQTKPKTFLERLSIVNHALKDKGDAFQKYLQAYTRLEPGDMQALQVLSSYYLPEKIDDFNKFLEPGLKQRPILVQWHRLYQETAEQLDRGRDLQKEYSDLLSKEPENAHLKYLLGRITRDPKISEKLYQEAEQGAKPIGFGWNALAYKKLCAGQFKDALDLSKRARSVLPKNLSAADNVKNCALAAERYEDFLVVLRAEQGLAPLRKDLARYQLMALALLNEERDVQNSKQAYLRSIRGKTESLDDWNAIQTELEASLKYVKGDFKGFLDLMEKAKITDPFQNKILYGQLAEAYEILKGSQGTDFRLYLVFYCAAKASESFDKEAEQALQRAIELLRAGNYEMIIAAEMLGGKGELVKEKLESYSLSSDYKSIVALSLSHLFPKHRELCRKVATKHNYQLDFPRLIIQRLLR